MLGRTLCSDDDSLLSVQFDDLGPLILVASGFFISPMVALCSRSSHGLIFAVTGKPDGKGESLSTMLKLMMGPRAKRDSVVEWLSKMINLMLSPHTERDGEKLKMQNTQAKRDSGVDAKTDDVALKPKLSTARWWRSKC